MRRRPITGSIPLFVLFAVPFVLAGCTPKACTDPTKCPGGVPQSYRPQDVPGAYVAPLYNLVKAYEYKDADAADRYTQIIDKDLFQFRYYDPQSANPTQPKFWAYPEEVTTTKGLLTDPDVSRIDLSFPLADTSGMTPSSVVGDPAGTMKITINGIVLNVQKGDVLYQTTGSGDYYIAPIAGVYKIIRWEDNTAPPAASPRGVATKGTGRLALSRAVAPAFSAPGSALREAVRRADQLNRG